jgi:DHA2 family multidrug resistance protein
MSQYEHANLAQFITPFERPLQAGGAVTKMLNPTTPGGASLLNSLIDTQAQIIGYIDDYKLMLITTIPAVLCLFLMRPPRAAAQPNAAPGHAVMD